MRDYSDLFSPVIYDTEANILASGAEFDGQDAYATDTAVYYTYKGDTETWVQKGGLVFTGFGAPTSTLGNNGDTYVDLTNGNFYAKAAGAWTLQGDVQPDIPAATWFYGAGTPSSSIGTNGNFYSDGAANRVWQKVNTVSTITVANKLAETGTWVSNPYTTTATFTPSANKLYLATVFLQGTTYGSPGPIHLPSISSITAGGGLTWTLAKTIRSGSGCVAVFYAMAPSGLSLTTIAANVLSGTSVPIRIVVEEVSNTDTTGTGGAGAIVQSATNTTAGATSLSVTLAAFGDAVNNATYYAGIHATAEATTPGAGQTELTDANSGASGYEDSYQIGQNTAPSGSWTTSSAAAAVAVEVKAGVSAETWVERGAMGVQFSRTTILNGTTTYAIPTNTRILDVVTVGAGGGSGGHGSGTGNSTGGGGGGGWGIKLTSTMASPYTVAVGAGGTAGASTGVAGTNGGNGGDTTFGSASICTGKGGSLSTNGSDSLGGAGGTASGVGDQSGAGEAGGTGNHGANPTYGGDGGASLWGPQTRGVSGGGAGVTGTLYGGGAGGCNGTTRAGAAGANGVIFVGEYR